MIQDDYASTLTMADRLRLAFKALNDTRIECSINDWDGYGARALQSNSFVEAYHFLRLLPTNTPLPEVSLDPDGDIVFEWYRAPRQVFSISVGINGELVYAGLFGSNKANGTEFFEDEVPKTILDNLARVYS
jgi:hypothetical protein